MRHLPRFVLATLIALGALGAPAAVARTEAAPIPGHVLRGAAIDAGQAVVVELPASTIDGGATWLLDLGTARWTRLAAAPPGSDIWHVAALPNAGQVLAVPPFPGSVAVFDVRGRRWLQPAVPSPRPESVSDVVADPARGRILAWSDLNDELWSYQPTRNRWEQVPQRGAWPTASWGGGQNGYSLMTFDTVADRAVLAILPLPDRHGQTWTFDPDTGRWTRQASGPPPLVLGYGEWGSEAVYDPMHQRSVLMARGVVATYDSDHDRWRLPSNHDWTGIAFGPDSGIGPMDGKNPWPDGLPLGPVARDSHQLVFDATRDRVVVVGGSSSFRRVGATDEWDVEWRPVTDLWAYDVGFNTWTRISGR